MRTVIVQIGEEYGSEFQGTYKFKEICVAKKAGIWKRHVKTHPLSGEIISSDDVGYQGELVLASMIQQPSGNPISLSRWSLEDDEKGMPSKLADILSRAVNRLNGVASDEAAFLGGSSGKA